VRTKIDGMQGLCSPGTQLDNWYSIIIAEVS